MDCSVANWGAMECSTAIWGRVTCFVHSRGVRELDAPTRSATERRSVKRRSEMIVARISSEVSASCTVLMECGSRNFRTSAEISH